MAVTEKCDVYSFGIIMLEVVLGTHPGDLLSSLSESTGQHVLLKDVLDDRISLPTVEIAANLSDTVALAFHCLDTDPRNRPTMHDVSQRLSIFKPESPLQDFQTIMFSELKID